MPSEFPKARLAVSGFGSKELEFTIRVKGGAGTPFKLRFVIESVDMAETARAKDLNYPASPWQENEYLKIDCPKRIASKIRQAHQIHPLPFAGSFFAKETKMNSDTT